jgi:hypothetical protein
MVPVLSLVDRQSGEVYSQVVNDVSGATIGKAISSVAETASVNLVTDGGIHYRAMGKEQFASHQWVDHGAHEYVRGDVTTNRAEGYFSQLKRSIDGTHHHVSAKHLNRYLAEFDFRYSTRKVSDTERTRRLLSQVGGRRLTYRPLRGER